MKALPLALALALLSGCLEAIGVRHEVPLLVVEEHDWWNATGYGMRASFGPHCAPVSYSLDPLEVTVRYGDKRPKRPDGVVVRDWRAREPPANVITTSADRLDVLLVDGAPATLTSPFDGARPIAVVEADEGTFVVNGTRLAPGEETVLRDGFPAPSRTEGGRAESVLVFRNVGKAAWDTARAGVCM